MVKRLMARMCASITVGPLRILIDTHAHTEYKSNKLKSVNVNYNCPDLAPSVPSLHTVAPSLPKAAQPDTRRTVLRTHTMGKSKRQKKREAEKRASPLNLPLGDWIHTITAPRVNPPIAFSRLSPPLCGPDPVNGAEARPPGMDEGPLFLTFFYYLNTPPTAQIIGGLGDFIYAVFTYARRKGVDAYVMVEEWCETVFDNEAGDAGHPEDIAHSIYLSRLFALDRAYSIWAWDHLRQGLGLLVPRTAIP